jgi:hypothetical protein
MSHIEHDMLRYITDQKIPARQVAPATKYCTGVFSKGLATCHPSDAQNSGVAPRFLENLWIHGVYAVIYSAFTHYPVRRTAHVKVSYNLVDKDLALTSLGNIQSTSTSSPNDPNYTPYIPTQRSPNDLYNEQ